MTPPARPLALLLALLALPWAIPTAAASHTSTMAVCEDPAFVQCARLDVTAGAPSCVASGTGRVCTLAYTAVLTVRGVLLCGTADFGPTGPMSVCANAGIGFVPKSGTRSYAVPAEPTQIEERMEVCVYRGGIGGCGWTWHWETV